MNRNEIIKSWELSTLFGKDDNGKIVQIDYRYCKFFSNVNLDTVMYLNPYEKDITKEESLKRLKIAEELEKLRIDKEIKKNLDNQKMYFIDNE